MPNYEMKPGEAGATNDVYMGAQRPAIMQHFSYGHLPEELRHVPMLFFVLAEHVCTLPDNAERATALRKLLEGKDAAVRAAREE